MKQHKQMREIKFRAWDKRKKEWSCFDEEDDWIFDYGLIQDGKNGWYLLMDGGKHIVLMQFTGLKDKNGKEIYESDEIEDYYENKAVVVWHNNGWKLDTGENYKEIIDGNNFEIIGNIYETR